MSATTSQMVRAIAAIALFFGLGAAMVNVTGLC